MSLISGNENKIFAKGVIGNVRKAQEDSHGYKLGTPNGDLFVVCDGMGGHVGGAMASKLAVDSIVEYVDKEQYSSPIEALDGALQFANMQILGYADAHPEYKGMGTTACIVLVQGEDVWIAHVGDSRIYLYLGKERQLHRITKDHSYVQTLVDAGEITDEEAEHHPNKNRILKALGIKPELHPSFNHENRPIHPKNGDIFLICSDGLSGMIPDSTIERTLGEMLTLEQKGEMLVTLAMQGETVLPGGQDNCTLELIEVDNSPWDKSEFKSHNPISSPKFIKLTEAVKPAKTNNEEKRSSKKIVKILIAAIALLLLIVGSVIGYSILQEKKDSERIVSNYQEKKKVRDEAKKELKNAQEVLDAKKKENEEKINKLNQVDNDLNRTTNNKKGKKQKNNKIVNKSSEIESYKKGLENEIKRLEKNVKDKEAKFNQAESDFEDAKVQYGNIKK